MLDILVSARELSCTFQQGGRPIVAVKSADFQIRPGDRIAIMGPSGCGKSTLLHLMGGLVRATSGSIDWPGLGTYAVNSILQSDHKAIMGFTLLVGAMFVTINLIVDLLHSVIDPRG